MNKTGNNFALFMTQLDFSKVIKVLSLGTERAILRIIAERPKTVIEVHEELKRRSIPIKYRESVYKALERLVLVGLAEKIYEKRTVRYKSKFSKIKIDLMDEKMELY